jgi:hypothetical protein
MIAHTENGWTVVSASIDGYLVTKKYLYYTREEAIRLFEQEVKKNE